MGPDRTYPPRLREVQAAEEEQAERQRSRRRIVTFGIVGLGALGLLTFLLYGLFTRVTVERPEQQSGTSSYVLPEGVSVQVDVRNACGVAGVAEIVASHLRAARYDVPSYGNAREEEPFTLLLDRSGDREAALSVARTLGIDPERIVRRVDSTRYVDVTILLGHDYRTLIPFSDQE